MVVIGGIAMLVGAIDPLEGALLILPGSGLFALGTYLGQCERRVVAYRVLAFVLIALGVGALWRLSAVGGFGGPSGRSMWWGLLILPYLIGWSLAIWGPQSPRWMLWLGLVVGLWYLVLAAMIQTHTRPPGKDYVVTGVMAALGALTIGGCIYRLRRQLSGKQ
jgi:steroid 5-alpha reductase family enzyme